MTKAYPAAVCFDCGIKHGTRKTSQYATWWLDTCDVCGAHASCTSPRDFGHLKPGWEKEAGLIDRKNE